jgi:hypothetical protein
MKTRFMKTILPVVSLGMITLSAGCADESKKSVSNDSTPAAGTVVAAPVDKSVVSVESAPKAAVTPPALSPGVDEIVQLAQAGVGDEVLLAYIENTHTAYNLNVDQILYLHDLGVSAEVISAMVRQSETLQDQAPALAGADTNPGAKSVGETASVTTAAAAITNVPPTDSATSEATNVTAAAPQQVTYNYFYNTLAPYGTWQEVPDYGWCWQPTVAVINVNWTPYCDRGRWLNTDCGWYWQSDYSWGWAPFHYGRWHRSPVSGWVWVPDTVWGPAWVTWRYSDAYCGWAPLPPGCRYDVGFGFRFHGSGIGVNFDFGLTPDCYTFIPTAYFCHRTPWYYRLPKPRVISIVHNTTIINNYVTGHNNTIVNVGPRASVIAGLTRNEIRKVALRDIDPSQKTLAKADRMDRDGATLAVFRPRLPEQAPVPPPEIRNRQQESRKKAELIAKSEVAKLSSANRDSRTSVASKPRAVTSLSSRTPQMPSVPPKTIGDATDQRAFRSEIAKPKLGENPRKVGEIPVPFSPSSDTAARSRKSDERTTSKPVLVKPFEQPRRLGPIAEIEAGVADPRATSKFEQPRSVPSQPNPVYRSQPVTRQEHPRSGQPVQTPQSSVQPDSGSRVVTPPLTYRPEVRRNEPSPPSFSTTPRYSPPPAQQSPGAVQSQPGVPRHSPPAYQPPQSVSPPPVRNEPVRIQPAQPSRPQSAPSFSPAPAPSRPQQSPSYSAPSAPSRSQPAPSSPSPSRNDGNRKDR